MAKNNWFQQMFDDAHKIHQQVWNYKTYEELPENVVSYILQVSDAERITDLPLVDINAFMNGLDVFNTINTKQTEIK
jgi:hypothetical protein